MHGTQGSKFHGTSWEMEEQVACQEPGFQDPDPFIQSNSVLIWFLRWPPSPLTSFIKLRQKAHSFQLHWNSTSATYYLCNFEQVYLTLVSKFGSHSLSNVISSVGSCLQENQEVILLGFSSLHKCFLYAKSFTDKLTPSLKTRCQEADPQVL